MGVKIRQKRPTCCCFLVRTPLTDHLWTPFLAGKSAKPAFEWTWKGSKTVKNRVFGHLMHSIAPLSPGLRYSIHLWGHWHHYNGLVISKKKPPFLLQKSRFSGALEIFQSPRPIWTFTAKKGVCQISNYGANCDVGVDFFRIWGWKYVEIGQLVVAFWSGHPWPTIFGPHFWLEKVLSLYSSGLEKVQKRSKIGFLAI